MAIEWKLSSWEELTKEELYEILALRIRVFVIEQNCPYQDVDGKDRKSWQLFAMDSNGECMACLRILPPGVSYEEWSIGRVATDERVRRTGIGKELMQRAMDWLKQERGHPLVRISAQTYLLKFYEGFGFAATGKSYLEDDIPHDEMIYYPIK